MLFTSGRGGFLRFANFRLILIALTIGCTGGTGGKFSLESGPENRFQTAGGRILGMDFVDPSESGDLVLNLGFAHSAAVGALAVNLKWTDIETGPMVYTDPFGAFALLNEYLPREGFLLNLTITAVDRTQLTVPADLTGVTFDDPAFAARYNAMLAYVESQMPSVRIVYLGLGNEVDRYTPANVSFWSEYAGLLAQVRNYIGPVEPGVKVGASATFMGLVQSRKDDMKTLNMQSDIVAFTYFPVNADFTVKPARAMEAELPALFTVYPTGEVSLQETGFPSGALNGSSDDRQSVFVRELFRVWDSEITRWKITNLIRLHEWSSTRAQAVASQAPYSSSHPVVVEFLRTLGLRTYAAGGTDKAALSVLRIETSMRGF
ncbi:MAG: hypothetical protein ABL958_05200 [Bdellovibrionia bacterium]